MAQLVEIRVQGQLDDHWAAWFEGFQLCHNRTGETTLTGPVQDQAALYGLLNKLRNLGLELVSIKQLDEDSHFQPD